jgi:hypothetical protein
MNRQVYNLTNSCSCTKSQQGKEGGGGTSQRDEWRQGQGWLWLYGRRGQRRDAAPIRQSGAARAPTMGMVGVGDSACLRSDGVIGSVKLWAAETFDGGRGRRAWRAWAKLGR